MIRIALRGIILKRRAIRPDRHRDEIPHAPTH